jgi:hypothetical protein
MLALLGLLSSNQFGRAGDSHVSNAIATFKCQWQLRDGETVDVELVPKGRGRYVIKFAKEGKIVTTIADPPVDLGAYPESLFQLDDGNLASLWNTGGPYFIFNVFADRNGKISRVLRTASKMSPEFAYRTSAAKTSASDKPLPDQLIIISEMKWVAQKTGDEGSQLKPVTATLYWWDRASGQYRYKVVPWKTRLEN